MSKYVLLLVIASMFVADFAVANVHTVTSTLTVEVVTSTPDPTPTPVPAPPPGGGGGGGGYSLPTSSITFEGLAYPSATISVFKDSVLLGQTLTDETGAFTFVATNLSAGTYNYGFQATDQFQRVSQTLTFQMTVVGGSNSTVSGILIPPTISLSATTVNPGENILVSGFAIPNSQVRVQLQDGEYVYTAQATDVGSYSTTVLTSGLAKGLYKTESRSEIIDPVGETIYSNPLTFGVGVPILVCNNPPDINGDGSVDLIDFSIVAYWWKRVLPVDSPVDLNCDTQLTLADFSILAFYWTG